ncbi:MAG: thiol-disulfide oxidoreductase DCC [Bacteroidetes bacterium]|nr:MAG: thiol-disulfide oxidoreductase DCC [Bacteroidota bacterium]
MNEEELPGRIVLFDGVCNFCNNSINFIIRHDKKDYFRFTPLQSEAGEKLKVKFQIPEKFLDSIILIENGKSYFKTTAALRIARRLNGLWPLMYGFIIVPPFIRDIVYNIIAKNRYRWWGKKESCMVPTPEVRKKFLS